MHFHQKMKVYFRPITMNSLKLKFKIYFFVQYFALGTGPYLPVFLVQKQYSGIQIGLLLGTMPIIMIIFQPLWSYLSDILGTRRNILLISGLGTAISGLCLGLSDTFIYTFMWSILFAAFWSPIRPISQAILFDSLEKMGEMDKFSLFRLWGSLGFAIATLLIGVVFLGQILVYFAWIAGGSYLVLTGLSLLLPEQGGLVSFHGQKMGQVLSGNPRLVMFLIANVFIGATLGIYNNYQAVFLQSLDAKDWLVGVTVSLQALVEVPLMMMVPYLLKRLPPRRIILAGAGLLPLRWLLFVIIQRPGWVAPSQLIHGVVVISFYVVGVSYIDQLVGHQWRATGQGLYGTVMDGIGPAIGIYLAGLAFEWFDIRSVWGINIILGLIGLGLLWLALRRGEQHIDQGSVIQTTGSSFVDDSFRN